MAAVRKWVMKGGFRWTKNQFGFGLFVAITWCPYLAVRFFGDRYAFVTAGGYGPAWVWLLPCLPLVFWFMIRRRWHRLGLVSLSTFIVAWLTSSVQVPIGKLWPGTPTTSSIRILTLNIQRSIPDQPTTLLGLLERERIDVAVFQEWNFKDPAARFPTGWSVRQDGTRFIASRWPLSPGKDAAATVTQVLFCATLHGPGGDVTIASLHLPSPRFGVKFAYQDLMGRGRPGYAEDYVTLRWARAGDSRLVADQIRRPVILAGDFNTIPISPLYRTIWGRGDWSNAFDVAGWGLGYTRKVHWWWQARIDHILFDGLRATDCYVGDDVGSDHLPLIAELRPVVSSP